MRNVISSLVFTLSLNNDKLKTKIKESPMEITSLTNAKVKQWVKYKEKKQRDLEQKFLIEGEHLLQEAHKAHLVETIIIEQGHLNPYPNIESYEVTPEIMKKISESVSGTYIIGICNYPTYDTSEVGHKIIVLDDVQDPGNVGTIIRSALSFGYDSVLLSEHSVDVYNQKLIRSTQGALFHIRIMRGNILALIKDLQIKGISIYATSLHQATPLQEVQKTDNFALVFGNEGKGVSNQVLDIANERVYIEMDTFESLNVAVAAGICMYYFK